MRIVLIESGGFVGIHLRYEVDLGALDRAVLPALERVMKTAAPRAQPQPTSAGETCIRIERDDGTVDELNLSHAAPDPEIAELVERLRSCAKMVRNP